MNFDTKTIHLQILLQKNPRCYKMYNEVEKKLTKFNSYKRKLSSKRIGFLKMLRLDL